MYQNRNNELEIITLYTGDYPARFYLRQISKLSKIPLKTCQNTLLGLEKSNVLKSKIEGKNKYFYLNLDNLKTRSYLLQAEIYKTDIFLEKYPKIKLFLKSIKDNSFLVVFGSFADFTANKSSDLDLLVIQGMEKKLPFHLLPFKVHQIILTEKTFLESLNKHEKIMGEIQKNHIILNNHSFYVNAVLNYNDR